METAKVVSGTGANSKPVHSSDAVDAFLDLDYQAPPQQIGEPVAQQSGEATINPSETTSHGNLPRKPLSRILKSIRPKTKAEKAASPTSSLTPKHSGLPFRLTTEPKIATEEKNSENRNARQRSPHSRHRSSTETRRTSRDGRESRRTSRDGRESRRTSRDGRESRRTSRDGRESRRSSREGRESQENQPARRMPRSISSQDGLPRMSTLKRMSLPRSSSERQYGTDVLQVARISPRSISRRWQGDDFRARRSEQEEEGELDAFFRFMEACTQAAWAVLQEIPVFISQLPEITMDILKKLIPALRGPTVPLIEGPRDEKETPRSP